MIRKSRLLPVAAAFVLVAATVASVTGCGSGESSTSSGSATSGSRSEPGSGGVLHFGVEESPDSLDPSQMFERPSVIVAQQIAEGLFETDREGKTVPALAAAYKTSPDGRTMTINLRKGVTFSNGDPLTSKDVAFSIEKMRKSPINGTLYASIKKVSPSSPDAVVLQLRSPSPALPSAFANYSGLIVPDNYGGMSEKEFAQSPIGTGPYEVAEGQRGRDIKLVPNSNYWKQTTPHLEEILFTVAPDETSRLQQIRSGELDITLGNPLAIKTGLPPNSGVRIEETPQRIVDYMLLNQNDPLFENPNVREAVNLAVDREGIIKTATDDKGQLGASFMPPSQAFRDEAEPVTRDVAKAKQLIEQATKEGADSEFTIRYYETDAYSKLATQVIQQNLEEVGLTVKLQPLDPAALNELLEAGEYEAVVGLYNATIVDPFGLSSFYLSFYGPKSGQDLPALMKVSKEASVETNEQKRAQLYGQLQEMLIDEEGLLILNYQPEVYPVVEQVTGVEFDGAGNVLLRNAGFSE